MFDLMFFTQPFGGQMVDHLEPKWLIKFLMGIYPLYHVWGVGGGMIVTSMTP